MHGIRPLSASTVLPPSGHISEASRRGDHGFNGLERSSQDLFAKIRHLRHGGRYELNSGSTSHGFTVGLATLFILTRDWRLDQSRFPNKPYMQFI